MEISRRVAAVILAFGSVTVLHAQTPPAENPSFEVASVKPNTAGPGPTFMSMQPGGRVNFTNVPLRLIIQNAYQVQPFQLVGAPDWTATARFDIVAKAPANTQFGPPTPGGPPPPQALMLRSLLAERFGFKAHRDTREMPTYALGFARADKKLGPNLTASQVDCQALMRQRAGGPPPAPPRPGERPQCGMMAGPGNIAAGSMPIAQLATMLSQRLNRIVLDRTQLAGNYDFTLNFLPDQMPSRAPGTAADQPIQINGVSIDPNAPSLMTALEEQLGLKLESTKGPVEVLVIDAVSQPTPD